MRKAAAKPKPSGIKMVVSRPISPPNISLAIFPKIRGTTIKKEKRAAFSLSIPNSTEVEMVAPEREIPGSIAIACANPIIKAWVKLVSFLVFLALSAINKSDPVTNNMQPTRRICPLNKESISSSKKMPANAAGIMEITIFRENLNCSLYLNCSSPTKISVISFLKTTTVLSAVAACNTTVISKLSDGKELSPKIAFVSSKCPLLLTGKNSVNP